MRVIKFDYSQMELLSRFSSCVCVKVNSTLNFIGIIYEYATVLRGKHRKIHYRNLFVQKKKRNEIIFYFHLNFHHMYACRVYFFNSFPNLKRICFVLLALLNLKVTAAKRVSWKTIRIYIKNLYFYFTWSNHVWF